MLGDKIRAKRVEKNLSLKDLAEKVSLTASFLSQVERNLAEPSITSLRKIAEALEVPIFYFLLDDEHSSPVVRKNERKILKFPESHVVFELLSPDLNRQMEVMLARLEVGAVSCNEPLSHPGEECIFVLEGKMDIEIGEERYVLEEGDSIYYFAAIPHRITNIGKGELVFLSAITPPRF
ncbi:MAG: cupin domain-containing protein [Clostridia bacterium]|jgi:transcriptional regulator with XRE-family HTH domain|nr:cupin domain-containing protein [Clostridia bacterium]